MTPEFDSIANYLSRLGVVGADPGVAARPVRRAKLTREECRTLRKQADIARRGIEEVVDDSLKDGFEVFASENAAEAIDLSKETLGFDLTAKLSEAAKEARTYGNAFLFVLGSDPTRPRDPDAEITGLLVLSQNEVTPSTYYSDWTRPDFGEIETYELHPTQPDGGTQSKFPIVHESHLIRFTGAKLGREERYDNNGFDDSVLEAAWESIRNFISTEQAIASIVQRFETATIAIAGLAEAQSIENGTDYIQRRMAAAVQSLSLLNAMLVDADANEAYTRTFANVSGLDTIWDRFAHSVAKAFGYPMTKLFGMSPSGQSTDDESGRANWRKIVTSYRKNELQPAIEVVARSVAGEGVAVKWAPIEEATAREEAEIDALRAEAETARINNGTIHRLEVREKLLEQGYVQRGSEEPRDPMEIQLEHAKIQNQMTMEAQANDEPSGDPEEESSGDPEESLPAGPEPDEEE